MFDRVDTDDERDRSFLDLADEVRRPGDDLARDPDDGRGRCAHEQGIRREVERDLDAIAARTDPDSRRATIATGDHHRHRKKTSEEEGQLLDGAVAIPFLARHFVRDVEMSTESLQTDRFPVPPLPDVELSPREVDLLPQAAHDTRRALRCNLDDRS